MTFWVTVMDIFDLLDSLNISSISALLREKNPLEKIKDFCDERYHKYYVRVIPDDVYDLLFMHISNDKVGYKDGTVKHEMRMYSLEKVFHKIHVRKFLNNRKFPMVVEPKIDGVAFSAIYKGGKLSMVLTRGDGEEGKDITPLMRCILPKTIDVDELTCRGEIYIPTKDLKSDRSCMRNVIGGVLKSFTPDVSLVRSMTYIIHQVMDDIAPTHFERIQKAKELGLNTSPYIRLVNSMSEIKEYHDLDFEDHVVDGIVIKINDITDQEYYGYTQHHPRWAIAWKLKTPTIESTVLKIHYTMSKMGMLSPVAEIKPVFLSNAKISKIGLHSLEHMKWLGIKIFDKVEVTRSGGVIPKITGINLDARTDQTYDAVIPKYCPYCDTLLVKLSCHNYHGCSEQIIMRLAFFVSTGCVYVPGFGVEKIRKLYNAGLVLTFSDLLNLPNRTDINIDISQRSLRILLGNIKAVKSIPLYKFIVGLSIPEVGLFKSRDMARKFKSIDNLLDSNLDFIRENRTELRKVSSLVSIE